MQQGIGLLHYLSSSQAADKTSVKQHWALSACQPSTHFHAAGSVALMHTKSRTLPRIEVVLNDAPRRAGQGGA